MSRPPLPPLTVLLLVGISAPAAAQPRCDCTEIVGSCDASIALRASSIEIVTETRQCARVDYVVGGQAFVSLVVDGEARQSRGAPADEADVLVQSCQICADTGHDGAQEAPAAQAAESRSDGRPEALIEVRPGYPREALEQRVEGYVELELTVTPEGRVGEVSVLASEPPGVFEAAALDAVSRWRYPADAEREPFTLTETIRFRPPRASAPEPSEPAAEARSAPSGGPRNNCVRQESTFNFGDVVQVGLINACDEAIMLFACAQGAGGDRGRWACETSEEQRRALVRPDDPRGGESMLIPSADGQSTITFADRFFISRAPNSEYWWLGCAVSDAQCRGAGRQWARSLDGQNAGADPQGRSSLSLSRSH